MEVVAAAVVGEGNLALRDVGRVTLIRTRPLVDTDPVSGTTAAHMTLGVGLGPGVVDRLPRIKGALIVYGYLTVGELLKDVRSRGDQEMRPLGFDAEA